MLGQNKMAPAENNNHEDCYGGGVVQLCSSSESVALAGLLNDLNKQSLDGV